ncbi:MAG: tetratricopeptide repeat protein [Gemmatimonadetes bacterium]|nr:tetratricopeptide repeat protein [Gemmatimonadota bacterium]
MPVILLYAACWLANAAAWTTGGAHRRLLGSCLLVALVALPINYRDAGAERLTRKRVDYYNFGALYQRRGDWTAAENMFREALRIDPSFAPAASGLTAVLAQQEGGDPDIRRGLELFGAGEYETAIAVFRRAQPSPGLHNNLGLCYYRLGQLNEAAAHFHKALALDASYARAHFNLGLVYAKQGDDQAAADAFAQALELDPDHVQAHYRRGEVLLRLGRPGAAEAHWAFLHARNPDDARLQTKIDSMMQANP